jgi:SpoVK/Ycf46/Vps4 family AAA+-type ATPase
MRGDILKRLIEAHAEGDDGSFRKAALQLAASESAAGHARIADEIRMLVARLPPASSRSNVIDIAQPRGDLADILEGGFREERLRDVVLTDATRADLVRVLLENRARAALETHGVQPRRRLLFQGPPGCGKTLTAAVIAGEMGLPLMTVRLAALFSRFLGATATHLRAVFQEMPRRPGVYLFDEFDSIGQARGDGQDVGEMRRVVTSFLQFIDADRSPSLLIAATNHAELLDRAIFRRFDVVLTFERPSIDAIADLLRLRLPAHALSDDLVRCLATRAEGLSFADVARACDDAIRSMVLDGESKLRDADLHVAFDAAARRADEQRQLRG